MAFNMGISGLLEFHDTLAKIQTGDYTGAAKGMLQSKWATQVGDRAHRLAIQMESGVWT
jgi:lysozyme